MWRFGSNPQLIFNSFTVDLSRFSGPETRLSPLHLPTVFVVVGVISLHATGFRKAEPSQQSHTGYILMGSGGLMIHLSVLTFLIYFSSGLLDSSPKSTWCAVLILVGDRRAWGFLSASMVSLCAAAASIYY